MNRKEQEQFAKQFIEGLLEGNHYADLMEILIEDHGIEFEKAEDLAAQIDLLIREMVSTICKGWKS